jgi:hypothetical protein
MAGAVALGRYGGAYVRRCSDCGRDTPVSPCVPCIKRRLCDRIEDLLEELLPNGHREGREFRCSSLGLGPCAPIKYWGYIAVLRFLATTPSFAAADNNRSVCVVIVWRKCGK